MKLRKLKQAFNDAKEKGEDQFTIEEFELMTTYAKYLLEYFEIMKVHDDAEIELVQDDRS